jgi:predicted nucleic acid-binding protein
MPDRPVASNNTPLVALWTVGLLPLLGELFGQVLIPLAVREEFLAVEPIPRRTALDGSPWLETVQVQEPRRRLAYIGLDRGESEVLALAEERRARLVILDERKARRYARRLEFPMTGTVGVLLLAKDQGLVPSVTALLGKLRDAGLFLSDDVVRRAATLAGELP